MSRHGRGFAWLTERTDGREGTSYPAAELRDGLHIKMCTVDKTQKIIVTRNSQEVCVNRYRNNVLSIVEWRGGATGDRLYVH